MKPRLKWTAAGDYLIIPAPSGHTEEVPFADPLRRPAELYLIEPIAYKTLQVILKRKALFWILGQSALLRSCKNWLQI